MQAAPVYTCRCLLNAFVLVAFHAVRLVLAHPWRRVTAWGWCQQGQANNRWHLHSWQHCSGETANQQGIVPTSSFGPQKIIELLVS